MAKNSKGGGALEELGFNLDEEFVEREPQPEGTWPFRCVKLERKVSRNTGRPMYAVTLEVKIDGGQKTVKTNLMIPQGDPNAKTGDWEANENGYIVGAMWANRIKAFLKSCDLTPSGSAFNFQEAVGLSGNVEIGPAKENGDQEVTFV